VEQNNNRRARKVDCTKGIRKRPNGNYQVKIGQKTLGTVPTLEEAIELKKNYLNKETKDVNAKTED
jgi:hypothetical protein